MSRTQLGNQGSSRLRRVLGLSISGAALVGLVYFEGVSARAGEDEAQEAGALADEELEELELEEDEAAAEAAEIVVPERVAPVAAPSPMAPSGAAGPTAAGPMAAGPTTAEPAAAEPVVVAMADVGAVEAAVEAEMPADPPAATVVAVPDLKGMSLRKARRELKAVGLKLSVRDAWGDKIDRDFWSDYRVRSQKIDAGTEVELGSWVRIKARERYRASQGY